VRLAVVSFATKPSPPSRGRLFVARLSVRRTDTGARLRAGEVSCAARLAGRRLALYAAGFRGMYAECTWRIPSSAKGKLLTGAVGVSARGLRSARSFRSRVAG